MRNWPNLIISREHTRFSLIEKNGIKLLELENNETAKTVNEQLQLSFDKVCGCFYTPIDEIRFIKKTVEPQQSSRGRSLKGIYGHSVAQTLTNSTMGNSVYNTSLGDGNLRCTYGRSHDTGHGQFGKRQAGHSGYAACFRVC